MRLLDNAGVGQACKGRIAAHEFGLARAGRHQHVAVHGHAAGHVGRAEHHGLAVLALHHGAHRLQRGEHILNLLDELVDAAGQAGAPHVAKAFEMLAVEGRLRAFAFGSGVAGSIVAHRHGLGLFLSRTAAALAAEKFTEESHVCSLP